MVDLWNAAQTRFKITDISRFKFSVKKQTNTSAQVFPLTKVESYADWQMFNIDEGNM